MTCACFYGRMNIQILLLYCYRLLTRPIAGPLCVVSVKLQNYQTVTAQLNTNLNSYIRDNAMEMYNIHTMNFSYLHSCWFQMLLLSYSKHIVWTVEHVNGGFKMGLSAYHTHYTERKMGKALRRFKRQRSSSCQLIYDRWGIQMKQQTCLIWSCNIATWLVQPLHCCCNLTQTVTLQDQLQSHQTATAQLITNWNVNFGFE